VASVEIPDLAREPGSGMAVSARALLPTLRSVRGQSLARLLLLARAGALEIPALTVAGSEGELDLAMLPTLLQARAQTLVTHLPLKAQPLPLLRLLEKRLGLAVLPLREQASGQTPVLTMALGWAVLLPLQWQLTWAVLALPLQWF